MPARPEIDWRAYAREAVELSAGTMEVEIVVPDEAAAGVARLEVPEGGPVQVRVAPDEWRGSDA